MQNKKSYDFNSVKTSYTNLVRDRYGTIVIGLPIATSRKSERPITNAAWRTNVPIPRDSMSATDPSAPPPKTKRCCRWSPSDGVGSRHDSDSHRCLCACPSSPLFASKCSGGGLRGGSHPPPTPCVCDAGNYASESLARGIRLFATEPDANCVTAR